MDNFTTSHRDPTSANSSAVNISNSLPHPPDAPHSTTQSGRFRPLSAKATLAHRLVSQTPGAKSSNKPSHLPQTSPHTSPRPSSTYGTPSNLTPRLQKSPRPLLTPRSTSSHNGPNPPNRSGLKNRNAVTANTGKRHLARMSGPNPVAYGGKKVKIPTLDLTTATPATPTPHLPSPTTNASTLPTNGRIATSTSTTAFISRLQSLPNYTDIFANPASFLYLKRVSLDVAYDFTIVAPSVIHQERDDAKEFAKLNPSLPTPPTQPIYTLSSHGLTLSHGDLVEFTPLPEFEREYRIYQLITSQPFFRQYHMWKGFIQWKNSVATKRIARASHVLQDSLFILHPDLRRAILKLRRLCYELSLLRLHAIDSTATLTMEEFVGQQVRQKARLQELLVKFAEKTVDIVRDTCDESLRHFLQRSGFGENGQQEREEGEVTEITFTERAAMRTFCRKLAKFIRLADFFVCDSFIKIAVHSTHDLLNHMIRGQGLVTDDVVEDLKPLTDVDASPPDPTSPALLHELTTKRSVPLFEIELMVTNANYGRLEFSPNEMLLKTRLENMLFDSLNVVSQPVRLLTHATFKYYVEPTIDENGPIGEGVELESMLMEDEFFQDMLEQINELTENAYDRANKYLESFEELMDMFMENQEFLRESRLEDFMEESLEDLRKLLETFRNQETIFKRIKTEQELGMLTINTAKLDEIIRPSPGACVKFLHLMMPEMYTNKNESLFGRLATCNEQVSVNPTVVAEFTLLTQHYNKTFDDLPDLEDEYVFLRELFALMKEYGISLDDETRTRAVVLSSTMAALKSSMTKAEEMQQENQARFTQVLLKQVQAWSPKIQEVVTDVTSAITDDVHGHVHEVIAYLNSVSDTMAVLKEDAIAYDGQQAVLKVHFLDLDEMNTASRTLETKLKLWTGLEAWEGAAEGWMDLRFNTLDIEAVTEEIHEYWVMVMVCDKGLDHSVVVAHFMQKVQQFRLTMPVVTNLRCPSLKERHWERIREVLGMPLLAAESDLTLGDLVEKNVMKNAPMVATITTQAENEEILFKMLEKVQKVWDYAEFEVMLYKERRDVYIFSEVEEIILMLDDSMVSINTILGSQYVGAIRESVEGWRNKLSLLQETLEVWLTCQQNWMHLEPIFAAPDIQKQMPLEAKAFRSVDVMWRELMKRTSLDSNCIRCCAVPGLKDTFENHNSNLDRVQKGLDEYLELKRQSFPRFYFLADTELLALMSHARDPRSVQPHMRKLFDAIYELDFGEQKTGTTVHAMLSQDKERVSLGPNLKARGNLEDWLTLVEESMKKSLFKLTKAALMDIQLVGPKSDDGRSRADWVLLHPAQCVTTAAQVMWANGCEEAIKLSKTNTEAMDRWYNVNMAYLEELTELIRSDLSSTERKTAVALVTADVHARDIVETLIQQHVSSLSSFVWQAQLRYYWATGASKEGAKESEKDEDMDVVVNQSSCQINYGYEYIGPTTRLVITPLTDRCWMTITSAYDLKLGAGPAGPAGTGKTESSKDLAKALAVYCIVFNCSEQINFSMVGRVFSGLAQCGAWTCLDEFNRIGIEVLSVIAQQITTLRQGRMKLQEKEENSANSANFIEVVFEGREINLRDHHIIITMNPNYEGRTALPDNLKVHFRPVYMMLPDYSLISEIIMYAEGFFHSSILCRKMTKLYKTASEMLSQQPHYDFGMRAVKSVLIMAGKMKRADPDAPEDELLIKAMNGANLPKLMQVDFPLYKDLVSDLFPHTTLSSPRHDDVAHVLRKIVSTEKLQYTPALAEKAVQLRGTLMVRFGVALVGESGSGKSTLIHILSESLKKLHHDSIGKYKGGEGPQPVVKDIVNPKCLSVGDMYGSYNTVTQEWKDGIAAFLIRNAANPEPDGVHVGRWIVFDGPIDPLWVENLNTVLDDNMLLCLASGERIKLRTEMKMLFEVSDLLAASPATVSRLGVVYLPENTVGIDSICQSWCENELTGFNGFTDAETSRMSDNFLKLTYPTAEFLRTRCLECIPTNDVGAITSQCRILAALLKRYGSIFKMPVKKVHGNHHHGHSVGAPPAATPAENANGATAEDRMNLLDQFFFYSLVWSWGGALEGDYSEGFNIYIRDLLVEMEYDRSIVLPPLGSVFDYFIDVHENAVWENSMHAKVVKHEFGRIFPDYVPKVVDSLGISADDFFEDSVKIKKPFGTQDEVMNPLLTWRKWDDVVQPFQHVPSMQFFDMIIPTVDTVRYESLVATLVGIDRPVFLTGESGCGKSALVSQCMNKLSLSVEDGGYNAAPLNMAFSSHTSSKYCEHMLEMKLEKKRKNLFGASEGKKFVVIVDDVNMPAPEKHGAQPPIELLRQVLDQGGYYEREKLFWIEIQDCRYVAAGAPPGGGRHILPSRFLRHFSIFCLPAAKAETMKGIFTSMLSNFMEQFSDAVQLLTGPMISGAIEMYLKISATLLPTPSRSHYLFSLRDVSKVFQGIMMGSTKSVTSTDSMARLWLHELTRVFHDRLNKENDREWYYTAASELISKHLRLGGEGWSREDIFGHSNDEKDDNFAVGDAEKSKEPGRASPVAGSAADLALPESMRKRKTSPLLWVDFLRPGLPVRERTYEECKSMKNLVGILEEYQLEFNLSNNRQMNLVFFTDAVKHVVRMCRVLRQPRGSVMLIGVGGSGRGSLSRLATAIVGYNLHTPEMVNNYGLPHFQEDLKKVIMSSGVGGVDNVFLMNDTQVTDERFLEDINSILSFGVVPNLFDDEEDADILIKMRPHAVALGLPDTPDGCKDMFVRRVREHLHVVLCMSPVGNELRVRVRHFPSLINCTTIDWFDNWPQSALRSVAKRFIVSQDLKEFVSERMDPTGEILRKGLTEMCVDVHTSVQASADLYLKKLGRRVYATPKSYVDMISLYLKMLKDKRGEIETRLTKLVDGLEKLDQTNDTVLKLQKELSLMQPDLENKAKNATELLKFVEKEQNKAAAVQLRVSQDEANVTKRQAEVSALQVDAKRDLAKAMPAYQNAVKALESLDKKDIIEIRGFIKPPLVVQTVMEAVCILMEEVPTWENARKILNRPTYMEDLATFDKDNISAKTLAKINKYVENPDMAPESVKKVSLAAAGMCMWVHAMNVYSQVASEVAPKQERLEKMNDELSRANIELSEKQRELSEVMEEVAGLQRKCDDTLNEKNRLTIEVQRCSARLIRAEKLKHSLKDEKVRWTETVALLKHEVKHLVGDVFLGAAVISYLGPFSGEYRDELKSLWCERVKDREIPGTGDDWDVVKSLGDPVVIRDWRIGGLPSDDFSAESGIIATSGERWPLMIDPQHQAGNWIKHYEGRKLQVASVKSLKMMVIVEKAVAGGVPLLIEDFGETVEPVLDNLLYKRFYKSGGVKVIMISDKEVEYGEGFRMYMTTNLTNPRYAPDVFIRTTVLNFTVTMPGLEEQLLADVVKIENPSLEGKYNGLVVSISSDKKQLASIEESILRDLHHARGHLLDNEKLVNALAESKIMSKMVTERLAESVITETEIKSMRESYRPAAARGSVMYFLVSKLVQLDAMYSYSLAYFKGLFCACIEDTPSQANLEARLKTLAERTTSTIHRYISRGLFEKHRLLFSFLLCCEVMGLSVTGNADEEKVMDKKISDVEWQLCLGSVSTRGRVESYLEKFANPDEDAVKEASWSQICLYCKMLPSFDGLCEHMIENWEDWKTWIGSRNAHVKRMPGEWEKRLSAFQKIIMLRCLCPEFALVAVRRFVELGLGKMFVGDGGGGGDGMEGLYGDMDCKTPCLFVLSPGTDVMGMWLTFAEKKGVGGDAQAISLGQGQGPRATALIEAAKRSGKWVLLQNVHLAKSWMDELERIVLGLVENEHEINGNFRLFLTSMPVEYFPIAVLQSCIKLTTEPPRGVKANVVRSLEMHVTEGMWDDDYLKGDGEVGVAEFRKLLYSLCVFHAVCMERKKYGSIGWNNVYDFSDSDLTTGIMTLKRMMEGGVEGALEGGGEEFSVPMESLLFVTGQIVYGGRVTDDWDRRCLMSLISTFYCKDALEDGYNYARGVAGGAAGNKADLVSSCPSSKLETGYFVKRWTDDNLPSVDPPTLFGMHQNADFMYNLVGSNALFDGLVNIVAVGGEEGGGAGKEREEGGGGGARMRSRTISTSNDPDDLVSVSVSKILGDLPDKLLLEKSSSFHANGTTDGSTNALSVVLFQEIRKFNVLLGFVKTTLEDLELAIRGEVVMSAQLESLYTSILIKRVPEAWMAVGYPSLKGLEGWVTDLIDRVVFMKDWLERGLVKVFWLPAFFFPQGFLTAVLQNYARKHKVAINLLDFAFEVLETEEVGEVERVEDGVLIHGLWMQSCRWDWERTKLGDEVVKKVVSSCPILHFLPDEEHEVMDDVYVCPCYKTMLRAGKLSTSGTSTNFVVSVELPNDDRGSDFWVLRGAALLCSKQD